MSKTLVENNTTRFIEIFNDQKSKISADLPEYINNKREGAIAEFERLGFPTKKNEDYKYTDVNSLFNADINRLVEPKDIKFNQEDIFKCDVPDLDTHTMVLLNGFYMDTEQPLRELPSGAIVGSFAAAAKKYPELVEKHYAKYAKLDGQPMTSLNTAFAQDGIFIYVPKNAVCKKPIQIINLAMSNEDQFIQHRNLIILEPNSEFQLAICDHTLSANRFITNSVTEAFVGENAKLDIVRIQNEHNGASQITDFYGHLERYGRLNFNTISLHGGLIRNNAKIDLMGEGAEASATGLSLADHGQHIDNHLFVNHEKPHCRSTQLFKGIYDDYSSGAFSGKIYVAQDAQETEAFQTNNSILLTDDAKVKTKPQLEIYADDVKCTHGATVGQLDEEAFFYIKSRGLGDQEARMLLMFGFAHEVISNISIEPLRDRIDDLVERRLRGELSRCNNCTVHCGEEC